MKMDILIVDDERHGVTALKSIIQQYSLHLIGKIHAASNIEDALLILSNNSIDIAFLDIQLSKGSGFDIAKKYLPLVRLFLLPPLQNMPLRQSSTRLLIIYSNLLIQKNYCIA